MHILSDRKQIHLRLNTFHTVQKLIKNIYKPRRTSRKRKKKWLELIQDFLCKYKVFYVILLDSRPSASNIGGWSLKLLLWQVNFTCIVLRAALMNFLRIGCVWKCTVWSFSICCLKNQNLMGCARIWHTNSRLILKGKILQKHSKNWS